MIYEIIENGQVVNTIVATAEFMQEHYPAGNYNQLPEPEVPVIPEPRRITVGAFYDRFGAEKWNILSSTNPLVQAMIKDASVRQYIDLDRQDLFDALVAIQAKGFDIDPQAIVSAEIQPDERP